MAGMFEQCGLPEPDDAMKRAMAVLVYDIMFKGKQAPEMVEEVARFMDYDNTPIFQNTLLMGYLLGRTQQDMEHQMSRAFEVMKNE